MKMTLILFWVVKFCLSSHTYLWLPYYMHHCIFHKLCFINFPYSFWCLLQTCCDVIELPVIYPSCRLLSPNNCLLWLPFTRKEIAPTYSYWPLLQINYAPPQQLFLNSPSYFRCYLRQPQITCDFLYGGSSCKLPVVLGYFLNITFISCCCASLFVNRRKKTHTLYIILQEKGDFWL